MKYRFDPLLFMFAVVLSFFLGVLYSDLEWFELLQSLDADNVICRH